MDRYDFACEWFSSSRNTIKKYTLKDAAADMRNLRADAKANPEYTLPLGLSARYLYETINALIRKQEREE